LSQREKQRNPVYRRKSSKHKLKQERTHRFRAGQLCWPCCAQAHSENRRQTGENEQAHFSGLPLVFFCPEALLAPFKLQAQIAWFCPQAGSPGEVQEMKSPGAELETAEVSNGNPPADFRLCMQLIGSEI